MSFLFAYQETLGISLGLSDLNFLTYKMRMILSVVNLLRNLKIVTVESLPKYLFHILIDKEIMAIVVIVNIITYFFLSIVIFIFLSLDTEKQNKRLRTRMGSGCRRSQIESMISKKHATHYESMPTISF